MKAFAVILALLALALIFMRITLGVFVIQPIGAVPEGVTIVYWRFGTNMPFVASADGIVEKSGQGLSLFTRGLTLAAMSKFIREREIARFGYSETLYLWSTDGKTYER